MHPLRALRRAALVVGDVVRGALAADSLEDAAEHDGQRLRPAVGSHVVRRLLGQRVEARREEQWARAIERLLQGGEDEAHAVAGAGAVGAVVGTEG